MRLDSAGDRPSTSKVPIPRCLPLLATIILALLVGACGPGEAVPDAEATPELLSVRLVVAVNPLPGRQDATAILSSVAEDGGAERVEHEQLLTTRSVDFEVDVAGVAALMLGVAGRDALELVETDWLGAPGDGSLTIRVRPVGMEYVVAFPLVGRCAPAVGFARCEPPTSHVRRFFPVDLVPEGEPVPVTVQVWAENDLRSTTREEAVLLEAVAVDGKTTMLVEGASKGRQVVRHRVLLVDGASTLRVSVGGDLFADIPPPLWRHSWTTTRLTLDLWGVTIESEWPYGDELVGEVFEVPFQTRRP